MGSTVVQSLQYMQEAIDRVMRVVSFMKLSTQIGLRIFARMQSMPGIKLLRFMLVLWNRQPVPTSALAHMEILFTALPIRDATSSKLAGHLNFPNAGTNPNPLPTWKEETSPNPRILIWRLCLYSPQELTLLLLVLPKLCIKTPGGFTRKLESR